MASSTVSQSSSTFPVPPADTRKHHVQTTLNYYKRPADGNEPPTIYPFKPATHDVSQYTESVEATIYDIAGEELNYNLDTHGFKFHYHETKVKNFSDLDTIKREYFPEVEQMLKELTGAKYVHIFNPIVRTTQTDPSKPSQGPLPLVHIDQTPEDSVAGAKFDLGPLADELLKGRFQVVHVWRPLKPHYKDPLAVADAHSVAEEDLIHTKVVFPEREGSIFNIAHNPSHRFYYRYGQTPNIVSLFKSYDSKTGIARRNPHTAFVNPETVDYPGRESVEVRTYVFYEPEQN
ncbi:hypothetical protein B0J13DRAFT_461712 [Dactylonectria estremocensis]|uniref:Methyltransferase n=1 Tax=Dactylonectria estremocensis TaxID=1079267 RepID=A0A9P9D2Y1_9HYPO|nr:hypothetical protein B0J13DRAFT_461712 [Dactylonectria estremocensis]